MTTIKAFVKSHPLLSYVALTFAISWGGILIVAGPGGFLGTKEISEVLFPIVVLATLAGPSVAGILLTGLAYGKAGLRDLLSRLLRWRVGVRWWAVALLTAPLTMLAVLLALSLVSPAFRPLLFVVDDPLGLLVFSVVAGLLIGIFEELGWMGFAVPTLLGRRYGVLGTGLIIGLLWGAGHFPAYSGSNASSGALPLALLLPALLFTWQPAYRILMVWVYERTDGSLPVAMLMSASFVVAYNTLRNPMTLTLTNVAAFYLVITVVWYAIVAVVALANHGHLSRRPPLRRRAA
jgi:membrane protease YdiL (CAAX protease family)